MGTAHINAEPNAFAETILMPGDPLRAKYIAETYLTNAEQVTDVRNVLGFTGDYQGKRLSVMASGMGIPSASIYSTELIQSYGAKEIVRIGSCGSVSAKIKLRDIVIGMGASTDSNVNRIRFKGYDFAAIADYGLLERAVNAARELNIDVKVGNIFSADLFYTPDPSMFDVMEKYNILGLEMEAAGLYGVAAEFGAKALTICTVSDHIRDGTGLTADERQESFDEMISVALKMAVS